MKRFPLAAIGAFVFVFLYEFLVHGPLGSIAVQGTVEAGRVVDYRLSFGAHWRDAWARRAVRERLGDGAAAAR